jgi:hypothetical protein
MMNSFWLDFVFVFAMIISINSQACNWTSCGFRNDVQCPPGSVEKAYASCPIDVSFCLVTFEDNNDIDPCGYILLLIPLTPSGSINKYSITFE